MPLHAQIACIGGNALFALLFLVAALGSGSTTECSTATTGGFGLAAFLLILAAAAGYTCWVLVKFRHYLSAEASIERELHVENLQLEIETLKARIPS
jgi:hypothetical protein